MIYTRYRSAQTGRYEIRLEMAQEEFSTLLLALGYATGAARKNGELRYSWQLIDLVNRMNATNPEFVPYAIPEKYKKAKS